MKIKNLYVENAFGIRKAFFTFDSQLNLLYGPNGCCKSSLLYIINLLASPHRFQGRDFSMMFRKMILHNDYDPGYESCATFDNTLFLRATFYDTEKDYIVELKVDPKDVKLIEELEKDTSKQQEYFEAIKKVGIIKNELPERVEYAFLTDSDSPTNLGRFQIEESVAPTFLKIADAIYGYKGSLAKKVKEYDSKKKEDVYYFTDFIIEKEDDGKDFNAVNVHQRRMSDGEKKIATLVRQICSPLHTQDILLVDNLDLHVFAARQPLMIEQLLSTFPDRQFIVTAHSAVLLGYGDYPGYVKPEKKIDVIKIRKEAAKDYYPHPPAY